MKKLFTLLLIALAAFSFKTYSQAGTACNADFNSAFINPNTVQFNPVIIGDSLTTYHNWNFGDGAVATIPSPQHSYASGGTYTVRHILKRTNPNGVVECRDTVYKTIQIQQSSCNLTAYFTWTTDAANWQMINFQNQTSPVDATDSMRWTFGDGTSLSGLRSSAIISNPTHIYANAGTYTVCLRVKKNPTTPGVTPCVSEICKTVIVQQPCNLVANFTWSSTTANPLLVAFQNTSVPLAPSDSIRWTFGDGTSSLDVNPTHLYANPGTYTVCLRVKKNNTTPGAAPCIREICKTVIVQQSCNLVANFTWTSAASNSLFIYFQNTSVPLDPTDSVRWTFGDGTSSLLVNPTHAYANPGTYTVCLRVKKNNNAAGTAPCIREICKTVIVQGTACNLNASFTSHPDSVNTQKIWFTNTSTGASNLDSIRWTFGDGTSSNVYNPYHIYTAPGTYTVCLRIIKRSPNGAPTTCISDTCKVIVVQSNCNFVANWSWRADSLNAKKIYFTNLTLTPTATATAVWNFGDGTSATSWNAVHEYAQPGSYRVCLKIYLNNTCVREKCDTVVVLPPSPPCNNQSNFAFEKFSNDNQKYKFTPAYINTTAVYTWTFGDGTGSHDIIATHRYAQPGTYTVCLTVWRSATCASTTCKTITVTAQINCNAIQVTYNYQRDPFVPNKVYFYAISNFPLLDQTWTIRKMPLTISGTPVILHQNNPVYVFPDTGYYQVCLRAITLGGCIKEYCNVIRIEQVAPQCILQAYPNPASSIVNVNVNLTQPEMIHTYVYNTLNILVKEKHQQGNTGNNVVTLNIGDLLPGMYNMKVVYGNKTCTSKFQKL